MDTAIEVAPEAKVVRQISEQVLEQLKLEPVELEFSLMCLDAVAELAAGGEVVPVDIRDHAGGFGGVDLLVVSLVPAVYAVLAALGEGRKGQADLLLEAALSKVEEVVRHTGSVRAADRLDELTAEIRRAVLLRLSGRREEV